MTFLGRSGVTTLPLALDGSVFGSACDRHASVAILDEYVEAGGNIIDTADSYSGRDPDDRGGESEAIIGAWLGQRRNRDQMLLATKIGKHPRCTGLSAAAVHAAVDASLTRLGTDRLDICCAHVDDPDTPLEETVGAFDALVRSGKIGAVGLTGFTAQRVREWIEVAGDKGHVAPTVIQPWYHLVKREAAELDLAAVAADHQLSVMPYFTASRGFMASPESPINSKESTAGRGQSRYFSHAGLWAFDALETIALDRHVKPADVAFAWLRAQPGVVAPIVTIRSPTQVSDVAAAATLDLTAEERAALDEIAMTKLDD